MSLLFAWPAAWAHQREPISEVTPELFQAFLERESGIACQLRLAKATQEVVMPFWPIELHESAGIVVRPGEKIPPFAINGFNLWQVWRTGELALVPRYDLTNFRKTLQGVNTHEAFDHLHYKLYGTTVSGQAVGSGELRGAFGEVWYVNNKSGKERGEEETLLFPQMLLPARGAITTSDTIWHAVNRSERKDIGHQYEDRLYDRWQLKVMKLILDEPDGAATVALIERLGRVLRPWAGGAKQVRIDFGTAVRGASYSQYRNPLVDALYNSVRTDGVYPSVQVYWLVIASHVDNEATNHALTAPLLIGRLIETQRDRLSLSEIGELQSISAGFAALPIRRVDPAMVERLNRVQRPPELIFDTDTEIVR